MNSKTAYPLSWPEGWPRTKSPRRASFQPKSIAGARDNVLMEINRLNRNAWNHSDSSVILSTNLRLRQDGLPAGGQSQPLDKGVAVYFKLRVSSGGKTFFKDCVLACDRWDKIEHNLYAIAKHIESIRAQDRWGVGNIEQAFRGYVAIPEKTSGVSWWEVLGVSINATADQINEAYRAKAKLMHPDSGGSHDDMVALNEAYRAATSIGRQAQ